MLKNKIWLHSEPAIYRPFFDNTIIYMSYIEYEFLFKKMYNI